MTVYFIGAGPGDPELITVKGQRLIRECPLVLYAGSLVPKEVILTANPNAEIVNTADLSLEDIITRIHAAHRQGLDVARVHTGDPALYGAIGEQMRELEKRGIPYQVVPGVTAAFAGGRRGDAAPGINLARYQPDHHLDPSCGQDTDAGRRKPTGTGAAPGHNGDLSECGQATRDRRRANAALWRGLSGRGAAPGILAGSGWRRRHAGRHCRQGESQGIHPHRVDSGRAGDSARRVSRIVFIQRRTRGMVPAGDNA